MAYSSITKPADYFNTKLYSGNSTADTGITGVGFQPDFVWLKQRTGTEYHNLYDSIRGATKRLVSQRTDAETTISGLTSFDSDGFTLGAADTANQSSNTYASWNWLAANGTASNTDGSITSTVSANTTAGFSVVSYTGNLTDGATVGHGLGVAPDMMIIKNRSATQYWVVYHKDLGGANNHLRLDSNAAKRNDLNMFSSTAPTSSVFELGNKEQVNGNTNNMIAYCFAEKKGYSKFGSYTGNGNADGTFIYLGFKPSIIIAKRTDGTDHWTLWDNKRETTMNPNNNVLYPSLSDVESTSDSSYLCDFTSNGIKWRGTSTGMNASGANYIYMAFAESPLVANVSGGLPTTAK